jgi:hypothetical protein
MGRKKWDSETMIYSKEEEDDAFKLELIDYIEDGSNDEVPILIDKDNIIHSEYVGENDVVVQLLTSILTILLPRVVDFDED